ncbi:MAG: peptidylprolyl isomerase [Saprospiraceae bacterium]|nr:peptidylprolyl isomerase [Saprospiraceae bacterium]
MLNFSKILFAFCLAAMAVSCAKPIADFSHTEKDLIAPASVKFENLSKNAEIYEWDFGDGSTSVLAAPNHVYGASGNYPVKLTVKKGKKTALKQKVIQVTAPAACLVEIETEYGTMTIQLSNATPQHRDNFIKLAEEGYYDGTIFHRVIEGFMLQGGDPDSKKAKPGQQLGVGGPSYTVPAEFVDSLVHVKGAICAARQGDQVNPQKRSSGSQFYIVQGKSQSAQELDMIEARKGFRYSKAQRDAYMSQGGTPFLDREYTVFGRVVKGFEVIDKIAALETDPGDRPRTDVKMKVRVIK